MSRIGFEWDDKSKFPEYNFKYSTANLNQMNTVTMKFYCDDKSIEPYMTITQKHIAMLDENCVNVKFPNVVSINFENENNRVFKPFFVNEEDKSNLASYKLKIYNRWGNIVFESSKVSDSWNLQYKDEPAAIDTYIYICELKDLSGNVSEYKGNFTIVK
ncbi:MAG: gliding motility-associated C-terminal domain-containing protein [Saprospiraceae bacterium]|nr:gliding motility-associated C-terminal domain-containing protein [Saprospiraceae bacterium]